MKQVRGKLGCCVVNGKALRMKRSITQKKSEVSGITSYEGAHKGKVGEFGYIDNRYQKTFRI